MPTQLTLWEKVFSQLKENVAEDIFVNEWLERYLPLFTQYKSLNILDLGCGVGNATSYLLKEKFNVISCDLSRLALEWMHTLLPHASIFDHVFFIEVKYRWE